MRRLSASTSPLFPPLFLLVDGAVQLPEGAVCFQVLDSVGTVDLDQASRVHGGNGARQGRKGLRLISVCWIEALTLKGTVGAAGYEGLCAMNQTGQAL